MPVRLIGNTIERVLIVRPRPVGRLRNCRFMDISIQPVYLRECHVRTYRRLQEERL